MSRARSLIKNTVALAIVAGVAFFFYRAFRQNWQSVRSYRFEPHYLALFGVALTTLLAAGLATLGWQIAINTLANRKLTFEQSVAICNSSSLTKYLPGKVWTYALQMYWLASVGIQKSLVLYVNLLNIAIGLIASTLTGLLLLTLALRGTALWIVTGSIIAIILGDLLGMAFHTQVLRLTNALVLMLFKRKLEEFAFSPKLLFQLHLLHFIAAVAASLGTYWTCVGIGYQLPQALIPRVMASSLLGDCAGFVALLVPGGIGVREGVMYFVLGGAASGPVSLLLPVVSRTIAMLLDIVVGATAMVLLRRFNRSVDGAAPAASE